MTEVTSTTKGCINNCVPGRQKILGVTWSVECCSINLCNAPGSSRLYLSLLSINMQTDIINMHEPFKLGYLRTSMFLVTLGCEKKKEKEYINCI